MDDRERRMPDGASPARRQHHRSVVALSVAAVLMVTTITLALASYFGWPAVIVGLIILALYAGIGGGAVWMAARLRERDHERIEEEVSAGMSELDRPGREEPE